VSGAAITPETLPAAWYHDPSAYQLERGAVFGREWVWFAVESELAAPGAYVAREYAGWRLFVRRGPDGELHGFHNVCRHRAGPLVDDGSGSCANLVCRYHGWAFGHDGALRSPRDFRAGEDFDPDDYPLWRVHAQTWRGQVFVHLGESATPLTTDLGEVFAETDTFDLEGMTYSHSVAHDLACNWKTYADNYLEGYHVPLVHPELNRELDVRGYRVELGDRYCRHISPTRDGAINLGRWMFRWPNLCLNIYAEGMNVEVIVPTSATTCTVLYNYFFTDPTDPHNAEVVRLSCAVMEEDKAIAEAVQRNLAAGRYEYGRLSPHHEVGLVQFHDLVRHAHANPTALRPGGFA
jgi:choline monooxygenase